MKETIQYILEKSYSPTLDKLEECLNNKQFTLPKNGDKIQFKGVYHFWFTNIIDNAKMYLKVGEYYTVFKVEVFSSWCKVYLQEFPDIPFALGFFDHY